MPSSASDITPALVAAGEIERDPCAGSRAREARRARRAAPDAPACAQVVIAGWLFGRTEPKEPIKGLYLHGEVGRGKTMLMDLFFESSDVDPQAARAFP